MHFGVMIMDQNKNCPSCGKSLEELPNNVGNLGQFFGFKGSVEGVKVYAWGNIFFQIIGLGFMVFMFTYGPHRVFFQHVPVYSAESKLILESHRDEKDGDRVVVLGKVKNEGDFRWSGLDFKIEFFDSKDTYIDECLTNIPIDLHPGTEENFKVVCMASGTVEQNGPSKYSKNISTIEKNTAQSYVSYKIKITNANAYRAMPF